jgi:hypothetical protein
MRVAQPVPGTENWDNEYTDHFWTGDDTFVSMDLGSRRVRNSPTASEFSTRRTTTLYALRNRLQALSGRMSLEPRPSPDGRWLMFDDNSDGTHGLLVSVDGTTESHWKYPARADPVFGEALWLPRADGWVLAVGRFVTGGPPPVEMFSYPFPTNGSGTLSPLRDPVTLRPGIGDVGTSYETASTRGIWFARPKTFPWIGGDVEIGVVDVQSGLTSSVNMPWDGKEEFLELAASPDGSKLAWLTWARGRSVAPGRMEWFYRLFGYARPAKVILRIVDGNGNSAREIGRVPVGVSMQSFGATSFAEPQGPRQLRWTPSGKYLSFAFQGKLWRLPVD